MYNSYEQYINKKDNNISQTRRKNSTDSHITIVKNKQVSDTPLEINKYNTAQQIDYTFETATVK